MATVKQKNLAKLTLENPTLPKGKLVELGGYSKAVQKEPSKALESVGYLEELAKFGLTHELISTSLVSDIKSKPKNRVGELRLGAEILKMKENEDKKVYNQFNFFDSTQLKRAAGRILDDENSGAPGLDKLHDRDESKV